MVNNEKDELLTMMQQTQGENSDRVTEVTLQSTSQQHPSKAQAAPAPRWEDHRSHADMGPVGEPPA